MSNESTVGEDAEIDDVEEISENTELHDDSAIKELPSDDEQITDEVESDSEDGGEEIEVKMREFNFGGTKLNVPFDSVSDEIADQLQKYSTSIQGDYTRGTQKNADMRTALEGREKATDKLITLNNQALNTYAQGLKLKEEISELSAIDLNSLWNSNPDQARQVSDALGKKQADFQSVVALVNEQDAAVSQHQHSELVRRREEGTKLLDGKYKNFSSVEAPKLIEYAVSKGMSKEDAVNWSLNPIVAEMGFKAMLYENMQKNVKNKPTRRSAVTPVKAKKSTGKSTSSSKDPNKMTMAEFAKWRGSG